MRICWEDIGYVIEETFNKMGMNKKVHIKGTGWIVIHRISAVLYG